MISSLLFAGMTSFGKWVNRTGVVLSVPKSVLWIQLISHVTMFVLCRVEPRKRTSASTFSLTSKTAGNSSSETISSLISARLRTSWSCIPLQLLPRRQSVELLQPRQQEHHSCKPLPILPTVVAIHLELPMRSETIGKGQKVKFWAD